MPETFQDRLNRVIEEHPEIDRIDLKDLPDEIKVIVSKEEFKQDKRNADALFLTLKTEDGRIFTQKYTVQSLKILNEAIAKAGGIERLEKEFCLWHKQIAGALKFDRMFPLPIKEKKPKSSD
jgi:hypothetical protein